MRPHGNPRSLATLVAAAAIAIPALSTTVSAADVTNYLKKMDRNGDELITRDELAGAPALARHFSSADENGDGALNAEEFEQLLRRPTQEVPTPQ
ncbi:MAG: EF-hand domain-containing protein [Pseudomonadota bacterium]